MWAYPVERPNQNCSSVKHRGVQIQNLTPGRISYSEYYFITNDKKFTYTVRKDKYNRPLFYDLEQLTAVVFMVIRETKVDKDVKHYLERDQHCFIVDRGVCFE